MLRSAEHKGLKLLVYAEFKVRSLTAAGGAQGPSQAALLQASCTSSLRPHTLILLQAEHKGLVKEGCWTVSNVAAGAGVCVCGRRRRRRRRRSSLYACCVLCGHNTRPRGCNACNLSSATPATGALQRLQLELCNACNDSSSRHLQRLQLPTEHAH